jgi:dynein heavy chain
LDVKQTRWHDDFGQTFKDEVKGIETFYTTIITLTFKHVSTCNDSVEMLENFQQLAKRESIKDFVHTKAANTVYQKIIEEIREIEQQFDVGMSGKRRPPMSMSNPTFGGLAVWALSLIQRLEKAYALTENMYFVPHC